MGYERRKEVLHQIIRGWVEYFKLADAKKYLERMDEWLRRRIRMCIWKSWKKPDTRVKNLVKCGIKPYWARIYGNSSKGYWANAEGIMHHAQQTKCYAGQGTRALWTTMSKCTEQ